MRRRKAVKAIALSTVSPYLLLREPKKGGTASILPGQTSSFESPWHQWPDMLWTGPEFWANRLQDWQIKDGKAICVVSDKNRSLHCLTCQLAEDSQPFETTVLIDWLNHKTQPSAENYAGFMLGGKGRFEDYRSAAVFGEGLNAGINSEGKLFIGNVKSERSIKLKETIKLSIQATAEGSHYTIRLMALGISTQKPADELVAAHIPLKDLSGNIALISHFSEENEAAEQSSVAFASWAIKGAKVKHNNNQKFGPICFAQYIIQKKILKLTAQLAPIEAIVGHKATLQIKDGSQWRTLKESPVDPLGRSAHFRVEPWSFSKKMPYRVRVELPLKNGKQEYFFEGMIAQEPIDAAQVKMAVFSCNGDHGFPDSDVPLHVREHKPDLAVFLGDQFYESTGGFGIQTSPLEKSSLDYLRKWYMFGWSYREIFRNIPSACIPDDHDVYHGNVWGEGGKKASTDQGWAYPAQDQGGYKMPPEWLNMVQRTQTSHLPDPYDPTPVEQGIGVYYTSWNYGGISMAILEDRKFKSAPRQALPPEAKVVNGFIQNPDFNIKAHYNVEAELLGRRQLKFLNEWAADWRDGAEMKAVLSQTNFCTMATLPKGSIIDSIVPRLPIPEPGEYVKGDAPTTDMDSNGWPQKGRDEALKIIRKCFALHIAGDQHVAGMVKYGIEDFGDAGYAFAGPPLNNIFPRRWWPPVEDHQPLPGQPAYTGNFHDGFGNKITVLAVANPRKTNLNPAIIYDRATGYGIVTFNKKDRTMKIECWPRSADPQKTPGGQYQGWPITVSQQENYGRKGIGYLPTLRIQGAKNPVLKVVNESNGEVEYTLRINGNTFQPKVFSASSYTVKINDPEKGKEKIITGIRVAKENNESLRIDL
ncbi:MAG: alkaline phosphatase D family protein [Cyclobacteriaceae bacterium]